jgi:mono/diheme cytochrome c family protein
MRHLKPFLHTSISLLTLLGISCQKSDNLYSSDQTESTRVVVKIEQGPHIGVDKNALERLATYRSQPENPSELYHIGRAATPEEIAAWDINIAPDGKGLPSGSGRVEDGATLYVSRCAVCHGLKGEGVKPYGALVASESSGKTIGNYWPYSTHHLRLCSPVHAFRYAGITDRQRSLRAHRLSSFYE